MAEAKEVKVKLFLDRVLTTYNKVESKAGILLDTPEEYQTVVAVGPNSNVSIGDIIAINYAAFPYTMEHPKNGIGKDRRIINAPIESIDGSEYLFISSREIKWLKTD